MKTKGKGKIKSGGNLSRMRTDQKLRGGTGKRPKKKVTWAKGHSSDSNPTLRRHRDAAHQQWISSALSPTPGAQLPRSRNQSQSSVVRGDEEEEEIWEEGSVAESQFSHFTNCTNPTFDKVHRVWKYGSGSPLQNDVLAILAAVTEVIHQSGGEETETEYFAAFLTTLENMKHSNNHERLSAGTYLLNLVIQKVPVPVLQSRFSQASQLLYHLLGTYRQRNDVPLLQRYLVASFCRLLGVQSQGVWTEMSVVKMMEGVLSFATSKHPRVRKALRSGISQLIFPHKEYPDTPHPAARLCAEFGVEELEKAEGSGTGGENERVTFVLDLLRLAMSGMSPKSLKTTMEAIFKVLATFSTDSVVAKAALNAIYDTFVQKPPDSSLPPELNAQIVNALYDFQPDGNDYEPTVIWLKVIAEGLVCLTFKKPSLAVSLVPRFFKTTIGLQTESEHQITVTGTKNTVIQIINGCLVEFAEQISSNESPNPYKDTLNDCLSGLRDELSVLNNTTLAVVLEEIKIFFTSVKTFSADLPSFAAVLTSVVSLREGLESGEYGKMLEDVIWSAVRFVGVESVMKVIPLGLNPDLVNSKTDFQRAWLLPVLKSAVRDAQLEFYFSTFFPLTIRLQKRIAEWKTEGETRLVHVYLVAERQLWELLPSFCKGATDLTENFGKFAKVFGVALTERPDIRFSVLSALRAIVGSSNYDETNEETNEEDHERVALVKAAISKYARNYLNILMGLYTNTETDNAAVTASDQKGIRLSILSTIRVYLSLASTELKESYLETAFSLLSSPEKNMEKKQRKAALAVMDILIALVRYLDKDQLTTILDTLKLWIKNDKLEFDMEKKIYRILEETCNAATEDSEKFLVENLSLLQSLILKTDRECAAPGFASRLTTAMRIVELLAADKSRECDTDIDKLFHECVKGLESSRNRKTRKISAQSLVKMVEIVLQKETASVPDCLRMLVQKLISDLGSISTTEMAAATLTSLRLIFQQYQHDMTSDLIGEITMRMQTAITDKRTPVAEQGLLLTKKLVETLPEFSLREYQDVLLTAFFKQDPQVRKNLRRVNEWIIRSLMRRLGSSILEKHAPEEWEQQIKNVRKRISRAERRRTEIKSTDKRPDFDAVSSVYTRADTIADLLRDSDDESDDDEMDGGASTKSRGTTKSKASVWLREETEDDIVDLLEPMSLSKRISTVDPSRRSGKTGSSGKQNGGFKMSADGRLVMSETSDAAEIEKGAGSDEDDDLDGVVLKGRKRLQRSGVELEQKKRRVGHDEDVVAGFSEYKPGGSGIHRKLDPRGEGSNPTSSHQKQKRNQRGDVKKKGQKVDPYAYFPLEFQSLNPRKRAKFSGRFNNLVRGARKGAALGKKKRK